MPKAVTLLRAGALHSGCHFSLHCVLASGSRTVWRGQWAGPVGVTGLHACCRNWVWTPLLPTWTSIA